MLKKDFPKAKPLSKVINKNAKKISYSYTRNMKPIISSHNKQILSPQFKQVGRNGRVQNFFPLNSKCFTLKFIYQAGVRSNLDNEYYPGLAEKTFKKQYGNHKSSFKNDNSKNSTKLSKCFVIKRKWKGTIN